MSVPTPNLGLSQRSESRAEHSMQKQLAKGHGTHSKQQRRRRIHAHQFVGKYATEKPVQCTLTFDSTVK